MKTININDIPPGATFPVGEEFEYLTEEFGAGIRVLIDLDGTTSLEIDGQWFKPADLKELRKLLKRIERQLSA